MAQLLLHLAIITIYENTFMTDSREFPFPWEFPGIPDLLFPFPGNPVTIPQEPLPWYGIIGWSVGGREYSL